MAQERVFTDKIAELEATVALGGVKGNTAKAELEQLKNKFSNEKVRLEKIKLAAEKKRRLSQNKVNQFAAQAAADKEQKLKSELSAKDEAEKVKAAQEAADRAAKKKAIQVSSIFNVVLPSYAECISFFSCASGTVGAEVKERSFSLRHKNLLAQCVFAGADHLHSALESHLHHVLLARKKGAVHFAPRLAPPIFTLTKMVTRLVSWRQIAHEAPPHAAPVAASSSGAHRPAAERSTPKSRPLKREVKHALVSLNRHCQQSNPDAHLLLLLLFLLNCTARLSFP